MTGPAVTVADHFGVDGNDGGGGGAGFDLPGLAGSGDTGWMAVGGGLRGRLRPRTGRASGLLSGAQHGAHEKQHHRHSGGEPTRCGGAREMHTL